MVTKGRSCTVLVLSILAWVLSGLLALMNVMAGVIKLIQPHGGKEPMLTLLDYSKTGVRLIGVAELLGAIGLILPVLLGVAEFLTPLAALGIAIIQLLAIPAHRKHNEPFSKNIVLAVMAIAVVSLRAAGI